MSYTFPGIRGFVRAGSVRADFAGKITSDWFLSRAVDALTGASAAEPADRPALLQPAYDARAALRATLETLDAALAHAHAGLGLTDPESGPGPKATLDPEPQPEPRRRTRA